MRKNICLRGTLRQPVRTLILLLLLAAAAFACFSQALQYAVLSRATEQIGGYYRAIGSLRSKNPDTAYDISGCMDTLQSSAYVAYVDDRHRAAFTMQDIYNPDIKCMNIATKDIYLYGKAVSAQIESALELQQVPTFPPLTIWRFSEKGYTGDRMQTVETAHRLCLQMDVEQTIAGSPDFVLQPCRSALYLYTDDLNLLEQLSEALEAQPRILLRAQTNWLGTPDYSYIIKPLDDAGMYDYDIGSSETPDLSDPALQSVREDMELLDENARTAALWATKDMTAIANLKEHYVLSDGRLLDYTDETQKKEVCVIRQDLAAMRGLAIGDKLTIQLRKLSRSSGVIRPGLEDVPWQQIDSCTYALEIVGLLTATGTAERENSDSYSEIYVPNWILPADYTAVTYGDIVVADDTNFVLKDIRDQEAFLQETAAAFAQEGYSVYFEPTGFDAFSATAEPLVKSARTNLALFGAVAALTLVLVTALYLFFRRKELPILRALGTTRGGVIRAGLAPMALLSALGLAAAGVGAYQNGMQKAVQTLASFGSDYVLTPQFSVWEMAALALGVWVIALLLTLLLLAVYTGRPVLKQLQSGAQRPAQKKTAAAEAANGQPAKTPAAPRVPASGAAPFASQLQRRPHTGLCWGVRWIGLRLARTPGKALLSLAVAACLLVGLGALRGAITTAQANIDHLYDNTQVTGQVLRKDSSGGSLPGGAYLPASAADALASIGALHDIIREAGCYVTCRCQPGEGDAIVTHNNLCAVQQPETFAPLVTGEMQITYGGVMDDETFFSNASGKPEVVLSEQLLSELGLEVGDVLYVSWDGAGQIMYIVGSFPFSMFNGISVMMSYDALAAMFEDQLKQSEQKLMLRRFEFSVDKSLNRQMPEVRAQMEAELEACGAPVPLFLLLQDEELRQVVEPMERNLGLMRLLYPIFRALSVLLAAAVAALLVLQAAKEAAIMRVLGVRRGRTALLLVMEQLLPVLLGIGLGAAILRFAPIQGVVWSEIWLNAGGYILGALLGASISALARVRRNPLELLQVKE